MNSHNNSRLNRVKLPLPIRIWNSIGYRVDLSLDSLIEAARSAEGLNDFGEDSFIEPLNKLLESIENEAQLHPFGQFVTRKRLVGLLRNRLRAEHYFATHPEILEIELAQPVVIASLQRTGTTYLQRLLSSSPALRSLKSWEALNPAPLQNWSPGEFDKRIGEGKKAEKGLRYLNPSFFAIHPVEYDAPEEEVLLLDISFLSTVAEATLHVPTFASWLEEQDQSPAYQYMKKLLQLLSWQQGSNRWVLKTPHHLEYLDVLRKVFPGCLVVQSHRDPTITVPSLCSMIYHGRFIFSNHVDAHQIGEQWLRKISLMMKKSKKFRDSVNHKSFIDINYDEFIQSPQEQVDKILQTIGVDFVTKEFETTLKKNVKNKYGTHKYLPEDFGLNAEKIRARLAPFNYDY